MKRSQNYVFVKGVPYSGFFIRILLGKWLIGKWLITHLVLGFSLEERGMYMHPMYKNFPFENTQLLCY